MKTNGFRSLSVFVLVILYQILPSAQAQTPGFFLDDGQPLEAVIPEHQETEKTSSAATVTISVDGSQLLNKVPKYVYGNNAVSWDNGMPKNATAMTDLKNLNPHVLRWPGGSLSDVYFWNVPYNDRPADIPSTISPWYGTSTQSWQMSTDEYYTLLSNTNSVGMITVNYGYARYGTSANPVAKAAHMAAEWVRYDNGRSKFWEIGNEDFGSWEAGYEIDQSLNKDGQPRYISGQLYGQHCKVFLDSMRYAASQIGVDIKIGVVAFDAESSYDPIQTNWNEQMMAEVGDLADFISVHSYYTPYDQNSTVAAILGSHTVATQIKNQIVADMTEKGKTMLPLAMTEWNIFAVGSMQAVSYINGMHAALVLGEYIKNGYGFSSRWDLVNGWDNGNDHAIFSTGGEPGVDAYNPRPAFFYMYYFQKYFGDQMLASTVSGNSNVISYSSVFSSGQTGIVLINKSRTNETVQIETSNLETGIYYYYHTLTGGTDNGDFSRKVLINGIETDEQGGGPDEYATIKARSCETEGGITVDLPALGVVYVMIDKKPPLSYVKSMIETDPQMISVKLSEAVTFPANPAGFTVTANGSATLTISHIEADATDPRIIHIFLNQPVSALDVLTVSYTGSEVLSLESVPLLPFTDENVMNLLPGAPVTVTVVVKNSATLEALEGCSVELEGESGITDSNGEANFVLPQGDMILNISRIYFEPVVDKALFIKKDSVLTILMDSADFKVNVKVLDAERGTAVTGVTITTAGGVYTTDNNGEYTFTRKSGDFSIRLDKVNYVSLTESFSIDSDVNLNFDLQRSAANVKFRTKTSGNLLYGVSITIGEETQETNTVGICTFYSVPVHSNVAYSAEKKNYGILSGTLDLGADTTVNLDLERVAADITFLVSSSTGLSSGNVLLGTYESTFNESGTALLESVPVEQEYSYTITAEDHLDLTGSLYLRKDTTISVLLTPAAVPVNNTGSEPVLYPNPFSDYIFVGAGDPVHRITLSDLSGRVLKVYSPDGENPLYAGDCPAGLYLLTIDMEDGNMVFRKMIRQ
ncbi:MAG: T9SS type A sorting domain-containing protein [Bacteroidota bacterium]